MELPFNLRDSYQNQVILSTGLMVVIPLSAFFLTQSYLYDLWIEGPSQLKPLTPE